MRKTALILLALITAAAFTMQLSFAEQAREGYRLQKFGANDLPEQVHDDREGQTDQDNVQMSLIVKKAKAKSITLKWSKVKGATKYELYRSSKGNKNYKRIKTFKAGKRKFTNKKLSMKKRYYYGVTAYAGGKRIDSNFVIKSKVRGKFKKGSVYGPSGKETYYNLNMSGCVRNMNRRGYYYDVWVRNDGCKMFGDYIMCAANLGVHPFGSLTRERSAQDTAGLLWRCARERGSRASMCMLRRRLRIRLISGTWSSSRASGT